jgi:hypothetical protein
MRYQPDLNEKVTIRLSVDTKEKLRDLCRRNDLDEAVVARLALEAGMQLAKVKGMPAVIEERDKILSSARLSKPAETPKVFTVKKGKGTKWEIVSPEGEVAGSGPLYVVRPLAKRICPPGCQVVILRENGTKERLV